jgi:ribosomal protein L32
MVKCSRCGKAMGKAEVCPHCGAGPSESVMSKSVGRVAKATGTVVEKGILMSDEVVKEVKPVAKTVLRGARKGLSKAKSETLRIARSLKEEGN